MKSFFLPEYQVLSKSYKSEKKNKNVVNNKVNLDANMFLVEISLRLIGRDNDISKSLTNLSHDLLT